MSKWMYVVGILLMAGFAVLMVSEMQRAATPYVMKVDNVKASAGSPVQFKGTIVHAKTTYDRATHETNFVLRDDGAKTLEVTYGGQKPANFDSAAVAVVRGVYRDGSLRADRVSVNCPSKYKGK